MTDALRRLQERLGHQFSDAGKLERALTHRSAASDHNERLEFLGDAVIELVVTEWLFATFPDRTEGELTRLRAKLVRKEALADYARDVALGDALSLGGGELKSGGRHRDSILADAFEALLGAIHLDAGIERCRRCLLPMLTARLDEIEGAPTKDPKTRLQEWLQGRGLPLPVYDVVGTEGADHEQRFLVECRVEQIAANASGSGTSRRRAEQEAAQRLLGSLVDERD